MNPTGQNSTPVLDDVLQEIELHPGPLDQTTLAHWKKQYPQFATEIEDFVTHWLGTPVPPDYPFPEESLDAIVTRARLLAEQILCKPEPPPVSLPGRPSYAKRARVTAIALVAAAAAGVLSVQVISWRPVSGTHAPWTTYETAYGEHRTIALRDGSTIEINTNSLLKVQLSPDKRIVSQPKGEAIFNVADDPKRPFIVETGQISIADVGTRFDVYTKISRQNGRTTRIAVFDGGVQVSAGGANKVSVTAGQQLEIAENARIVGQPRHLTEGDIERMTAWRHGEIVLDGPLIYVITEFDRYQPVCFRTTDPQILQQRLGGTLLTPDVNSFLGLLSEMGIHSTSEYDKSGRRVITLGRYANKDAGRCL